MRTSPILLAVVLLAGQVAPAAQQSLAAPVEIKKAYRLRASAAK